MHLVIDHLRWTLVKNREGERVRETERQAARQANRQADRQAYRQAYRQAGGVHTDRDVGGGRDRDRPNDWLTDRDIHRQTGRLDRADQTDMPTYRQKRRPTYPSRGHTPILHPASMSV